MTAVEHTQIVIALLTVDAHGDLGDIDYATNLLTELSRPDLLGVLTVAVAMLANEIELGCKDAGYDIDEYLQLIALVNAREEAW